MQASRFATTGHRSGNFWVFNQIAYRCINDATDIRCSSGITAFYRPAKMTIEGPSLTFCPPFWTKTAGHAEDLASKRPSHWIHELISYEHIVTHEYMHCNLMGHVRNIIDQPTAKLPSSGGGSVVVYGATRCQEWAEVYYNRDDPQESKVNRYVYLNGTWLPSKL